MRHPPRFRFAQIVTLFCVCSVLLTAVAIVPLLLRVSRTLTERQSSELVRDEAHDASVLLASELNEEWAKLQYLAPFIVKKEDPATLRIRLDTIKSVNPDCAWIGFADASGRVTAASGGILQGDSVTERPWFQFGIDHPYAGDQHEALLLERYVQAPRNEPLRLVDLSLPVRQPDGTLAGVLVMHIDWRWVRNLLRTVHHHDGLELLLVARDQTVLVGPDTLEGKRLSVHSAEAVRQGVNLTDTETWPDGVPYLVSVVPVAAYHDLPGFGWSIVARHPAAMAFAPAREASRQLLPVLAGIGLLLVLLSVVVGRFLSAPIRRLTVAAADMADGRFSIPVPDERRYREAALLSAALARLQTTAASDLNGTSRPRRRTTDAAAA
jgi:hypothetical protein